MKQSSNQPWWSGQRGEWYVVIQFLLFALFAFGPESMAGFPRWGGRWQSVTQLFGGFFAVSGLLLLGAGVLHLGRNLAVVPHPKDDSELVVSGAYGLVRHPIYSGIILGAAGWSIWKGSTLMLLYALLLLVFFDIKSRREERWLSDKFDSYVLYQEKVRKLIPFVY